MFEMTIWQFITRYWPLIVFYLPLGVIGIWRWSVWLVKKTIASRYRLIEGEYKATVSVVTPVYNEDNGTFWQALRSWAKNGVDEVIAVIDYTDTACIETFSQFSQRFPSARLIITEKPGKRLALAEGIRAASGEIVALADSDTIWSENALSAMLAPFCDPKVGGVGSRQAIWRPKTLAQRFFDIRFSTRYDEDLRAQSTFGQAVTCLSGRTALYRREVLTEEVLGELEHETFAGQLLISGDDKCLTRSILKRGWRTIIQDVTVYTTGFASLLTYLKQYLRWSRNSWRSDFKALLTEGWAWRHPFLAFCMIDRATSCFTSLIAPIYLGLAVLKGQWGIVLGLLAWWLLSRSVRITGHLRRHPKDILVAPIHTFMLVAYGLVRLYALMSLTTDDWGTRWDKRRVLVRRLASRAFSYSATAIAIFVLTFGVNLYKPNPTNVPAPKQVMAAQTETKSIVEPTVEPVSVAASPIFQDRRKVVRAGATAETKPEVERDIRESGQTQRKESVKSTKSSRAKIAQAQTETEYVNIEWESIEQLKQLKRRLRQTEMPIVEQTVEEQTQKPGQQEIEVTVQAGDTLWNLWVNQFDSAPSWSQLIQVAEFNNLSWWTSGDGTMLYVLIYIYPGDVLTLMTGG